MICIKALKVLYYFYNQQMINKIQQITNKSVSQGQLAEGNRPGDKREKRVEIRINK
jgi:hypothetical protein